MKIIEKVQRNISRIPFRYLLTGVMIIVSVFLLTVIGTIMLIFSKRYIVEEYNQSHDSYMTLFSDFLESQFETIIGDARDLLENSTYIYVMEDNQKAKNTSKYYSSEQQLQIDRIFMSIEDRNEFIRGMLALSNSGKFRYVAKNGLSTKVNEFYKEGNLLEQEWVSRAQEAQGKEVIVSWNVLDETDENNFSVVKQMNNPSMQKCMGYVVITVSKKVIRQALGGHGNILENNRYFIVDPAENKSGSRYLVYAKNLEEEQLNEIMEDYADGREDTYIYGSHWEENSGWEIVSVIQKEDLDAETRTIHGFIILSLVIMLAICIPTSGFLAARIDKPLLQLEEAISHLAEGDYRPDIQFDDSEIGKVGQYLLNISKNNLELREKLLSSELNEKEAELLLLQEQINPHFLYNTLDALYFMAVIDQTDDIAEMVKALSDVFKLSLNKGDKIITIANELKKIEAYMKIQNLRYQNKFTLEIDVAENILQEKILTFLLQPIVENAVTHGLENKLGSGVVSIVGYREGEEIRITVHDNGVGIDDMQRLENGYGVKNIRERIRLFYGDEYDVLFESSSGEGTTVFFHFPVLREG